MNVGCGSDDDGDGGGECDGDGGGCDGDGDDKEGRGAENDEKGKCLGNCYCFLKKDNFEMLFCLIHLTEYNQGHCPWIGLLVST